MKRPLITLLTDFGTADHYVASMKSVILGICPDADLIDISHEVTRFSIPAGAYTLAQAWQCFPKGTTHLAVVDPGVGSARRAIIAEVAGHRFVAPDNGLLSMILHANPRAKVREISATKYFRQPVSNTFHGRDIFAPVAAHLARGLPAARFGKAISDAVLGDFTKPTQLRPGRWAGNVLNVDRFGNIVTNLDWATFHAIAAVPFRLKMGHRIVSRFRPTYAEAPAGQPFAISGSSGYVEVSLNQSDAASLLGLAPGAPIRLSLVPSHSVNTST
jgi:S-adenosyl-L-methionine hydrolase (adenosine-forming)